MFLMSIFPARQSLTPESEGHGDKTDLCQVQVPSLEFQLQRIRSGSINRIVQLTFIHQPRPLLLLIIYVAVSFIFSF